MNRFLDLNRTKRKRCTFEKANVGESKTTEGKGNRET